MSMRESDVGRVLPALYESVTVPNITDGDTADVACTAVAGFKVDDPACIAFFCGPPLANLGIVGAWVSDETTGVVTIRFSALTGNVTGAAQKIGVQMLPKNNGVGI